jgi:hypothetical protein
MRAFDRESDPLPLFSSCAAKAGVELFKIAGAREATRVTARN